MKNLTINNQILNTTEFLIPSSTGEYLPTNITTVYEANDELLLDQCSFDNSQLIEEQELIQEILKKFPEDQQ